jgi:anti-anti-sigma factor
MPPQGRRTMLKVNVEKRLPAAIIKLEGRLDVLTSKDLRDALVAEIEGGVDHLVLDFGRLDYVSSAGLRVLIEARKLLKPRKGTVSLAGVQPFIKTILTSTGFDTLFPIHETVFHALRNQE